MELKLENHNCRYELQNIINLFQPYIDKGVNYTVLSNANGNICTTQILEDEQIIGEVSKDINTINGVTGSPEYRLRLALKATLYKALFQLTNQTMPWGILTGIRPTKIVHRYIKRNYNPSEMVQVLLEEYCISREKAQLMVEVAQKEKQILSQNQKEEISIYIGIPFCPTRCLYCSFTSYSLEKKSNQVDGYLDALIKEIEYVAQSTKERTIRSIYIGGGTPTSLNEIQLAKLLHIIDQRFDIKSIEEYTVEAGRPDTISREKLRIMKNHGVNRISINPQTMNQKTLKVIGRHHGVEEIVRVFHEAREEGHENINMDLILGLPGETYKDVFYTMEQIKKLKPDSITVHTMAIKRASRLKQKQSNYQLANTEDIEKMLQITLEGANNMNMSPYYMYRQKDMLGNFENVGYATPGKECNYNVQMIAEQETIIAMGAGAVTKLVHSDGSIERIPNVKNVEDYIARIDEMIQRKNQV